MDPAKTFPARRDVPWDEIDGRVVLALPRHITWVQRIVSHIFPLGQTQIVTLDGPAAQFWLACDGRHATREIAKTLGDIPHAEARAQRFVADLAARGFLSLHEAPTPTQDRARGLTPEKGYARLRCRRCKRDQPLRLGADTRWFCPHCRRLNRIG